MTGNYSINVITSYKSTKNYKTQGWEWKLSLKNMKKMSQKKKNH